MNTPSSTARPSLGIVQQIQLRAAAALKWLVALHDEISDLRAEVKRRAPGPY